MQERSLRRRNGSTVLKHQGDLRKPNPKTKHAKFLFELRS